MGGLDLASTQIETDVRFKVGSTLSGGRMLAFTTAPGMDGTRLARQVPERDERA